MAEEAGPDSFPVAIIDWALVGWYLSLVLAEFGQETQSRVGYHKTLKDEPFLKVFTEDDVKFYNKNKKLLYDPINNVKKEKIFYTRWKVKKKNRRNNKITNCSMDHENPKYCPGCAVIFMIAQSHRDTSTILHVSGTLI